MDIFEKNWFEIIGLELSASEEMISKTIRKLSLKYHPDKTTDSQAIEMFLLIQKAKEILLDNDKRNAIIEHHKSINKRKEYDNKRIHTMNEQRKRFKEQLDKKVNEEQTTKQSSSSNTPSYPASNIDKLRKENQQRKEESKMNDEKKKSTNINKSLSKTSYQIKIKWKRSHQSHSEDSLYQLFKIYGDITNISLTGDKGNAAIITFTDKPSVDKAVYDYNMSNDYKVTLLDDQAKKKPSILTHDYSKNTVNSFNISSLPKNNVIYDEMKRAMEREEINRKLREEEDFGSFDNEINSNKFYNNNKKDNNIKTNKTIQIPFFNNKSKITLDFFLEKETRILNRLKEYINNTN